MQTFLSLQRYLFFCKPFYHLFELHHPLFRSSFATVHRRGHDQGIARADGAPDDGDNARHLHGGHDHVRHGGEQRLVRATGGVSVDASSTLSIRWQILQYLLIRASKVFMYVTMTEFFNDQLPEGLRSLDSAMSIASMSAGSFASSLLVTLVMTITCRGGRLGWIPQDLNKGHVDWFFYLIAELNAVDLFAVRGVCQEV